MFTLLLAFIVAHQNVNYTAVTQGQYYEVVRMEYDVSANKTYGVFARYNVDPQGNVSPQHFQLRNLDGKVTEKDLLKAAPADSYIIKIRE